MRQGRLWTSCNVMHPLQSADNTATFKCQVDTDRLVQCCYTSSYF